MDLTFTNGTTEQQERTDEALGQLLNYNVEDVTLNVEVTFVESTGQSDGNRFAYSSASSGAASIEIRDDAPSFEDELTVGFSHDEHQRFYREIVARELGRIIITGTLLDEQREKLEVLFNAPAENWEAGEWHERPIEGIVETFKAALLPRHLRQFHNRTQVSIPLELYPTFRRIVRGARSIPGQAYPRDTIASTFTTTLSSGNRALYVIDNGTPLWDAGVSTTIDVLHDEFGLEPAVFDVRPAAFSAAEQTLWSVRSVNPIASGAKDHLAERRDRGLPLQVRYREGFAPSPFGGPERLGSALLQGLAIAVTSMPMQYVCNYIEKYAPTDRSPELPYITPAELDDLLPVGTVIPLKYAYILKPVWVLEDETLAMGEGVTVEYDMPFEVKEYRAFSGGGSSAYPGLNGYIPWMAPAYMDFEYVGSNPPRGTPSDIGISRWPAISRDRWVDVPIHPHAAGLFTLLVGYPHRDSHQFDPEPPRFSGGSSTVTARCRGMGQYWISEYLSWPGYSSYGGGDFPISQTEAILPAEQMPPIVVGGMEVPVGSMSAFPGGHGARSALRPVIGR